MYKKKLFIFTFFILANCSIPNTSFLGPIYTGAKTGNVFQTSLSYSSGKFLNKIKTEHTVDKNKKDMTFIKKNPILPNIPYVVIDPVILVAYKVNIVEISEVLEPEPLP